MNLESGHSNKDSELADEYTRLSDEVILLLKKYNYSPIAAATHIPEPQRLNDIERIKTLTAEMDAHDEKKKALEHEKPIYPKPMHTH